MPPPTGQFDELASLRSEMLKFARNQLRDDSAAEDAVQEALVAAMGNLKDFKNRAQLKTWVLAILKNKIVDIIRSRSRSHMTEIQTGDIYQNTIDELFDDDDRWEDEFRPSHWDNPEQSFSNQQFWEILDICLNRLPENTARVFMMREVLGLETDEICRELAISQSNCGVVLYRARMALRTCLDDRWFKKTGMGETDGM